MSKDQKDVISQDLWILVDDYIKTLGLWSVDGPPVAYFELDDIRYTYVTLWGCYIKGEFKDVGIQYTNPRVALGDFFKGLSELVKDFPSGSTVVWRRRPQIAVEELEDDFDRVAKRIYRVTARLCVVPPTVTAEQISQVRDRVRAEAYEYTSNTR